MQSAECVNFVCYVSVWKIKKTTTDVCVVLGASSLNDAVSEIDFYFLTNILEKMI